MNTRLIELVETMKRLEKELAAELQKSEAAYSYKIHGTIVTFEEWVIHEQREFVQKVIPYLREASWGNIVTAPVIWACLPPVLFLDLMLTLFQAVCFPVYGIPKVRRGDHIILDHRALSYLNSIEKMNCSYCAYFRRGLLRSGDRREDRTVLVPDQVCPQDGGDPQPIPQVLRVRRC
ncbi:MAG: hypothetical protein ACYC7L_00515 [Nitrospirota bacterium]